MITLILFLAKVFQGPKLVDWKTEKTRKELESPQK